MDTVLETLDRCQQEACRLIHLVRSTYLFIQETSFKRQSTVGCQVRMWCTRLIGPSDNYALNLWMHSPSEFFCGLFVGAEVKNLR